MRRERPPDEPPPRTPPRTSVQPPPEDGGGAAGSAPFRLRAGAASGASARSCTLPCNISYADSGSTVLSYLPRIGLLAMTALRSALVTGPRRADGGQINARSTIDGVPLPSRNDTSASPLPNSVITFAVSSFGLGR